MEPEEFPRVTLATLEHTGVPYSHPTFLPLHLESDAPPILPTPNICFLHTAFLATLNPSLTKDFDRKMSLCLFWDLLAARYSPIHRALVAERKESKHLPLNTGGGAAFPAGSGNASSWGP